MSVIGEIHPIRTVLGSRDVGPGSMIQGVVDEGLTVETNI